MEGMKVKLAILVFLAGLGLSWFMPAPAFCIYCQGGTPCYSDGDCYLGCKCQAAPYSQGVCIQHF